MLFCCHPRIYIYVSFHSVIPIIHFIYLFIYLNVIVASIDHKKPLVLLEKLSILAVFLENYFFKAYNIFNIYISMLNLKIYIISQNDQPKDRMLFFLLLSLLLLDEQHAVAFELGYPLQQMSSQLFFTNI